jgi:nicotinamidase/pyrazinamidase
MKLSNILFWNIDTQIDFMEPGGRLYTSGSEDVIPILEKITLFAKKHRIRVINTCDYHQINSSELSSNPDFVNSFPQHCMAGTRGADFIPETAPELPVVIGWEKDVTLSPEIKDEERYRNIILRKDNFDVFKGNPYTDKVLEIINPEIVIVYGVATNIAINKAVIGLVERGKKVFIINDAIKELPDLPLPFEEWEKIGVEMITFAELKKSV